MDDLSDLQPGDTLIGGAGDDVYDVLYATTEVIEAAGEGNDTVIARTSFALPPHVEDLVLTHIYRDGHIPSPIPSGQLALNGTGNALANLIIGNAEANRISGGGGDDRLRAAGGADTLEGGSGNDTLDGGQGRDIAIFAGARGEYEVTRAADRVTVRHLDGAEGTDTLVGVERLRFSDGMAEVAVQEIVLRGEGGRLLGWDVTRGEHGFTVFGGFAPDVMVLGVGDFAGDGSADMLLRQASGDILVWAPFRGADGFRPLPEAKGAAVAAIGDLNGDDRADLLLRDGSQFHVLDGVTGSRRLLLTPADGYQFAAVGDVDGRGGLDVVLRDGLTGAHVAWTEQGRVDLLTLAPGSGWRLAALADMTGTGMADLLLLNEQTRALTIWDAGQGADGFRPLFELGAGWTLVGVSDISGDGRADILLRETASGHSIAWTGSAFLDLGDVLAAVGVVGFGDF
ncbi:MAG TPA: hypothetical protein VED40_00920 [Azospirillaceae bacterium]|nr:hypothetical protein [Azospirillaceae bacterium]